MPNNVRSSRNLPISAAKKTRRCAKASSIGPRNSSSSPAPHRIAATDLELIIVDDDPTDIAMPVYYVVPLGNNPHIAGLDASQGLGVRKSSVADHPHPRLIL